MRYLNLSVQTLVLAGCLASIFIIVPADFPPGLFWSLTPLIWAQLLFTLHSLSQRLRTSVIHKILMLMQAIAASASFYADVFNRIGWEVYWITASACIGLLGYILTWWNSFHSARRGRFLPHLSF